MTTATWHVSEALWQRYAAGDLDVAAAASVEAHVSACPVCRAAASRVTSPVDTAPVAHLVEPVWESIATTIARPPTPPLWRALLRLGLPREDVVVVRSSTGLYLPWVISISTAVICAVLAGVLPAPRGDLAFAVLAPLIPVLAVASAYDTTDPIRELTGPTPLSKLRIALLRTATALVVALPVTTVVGLLVPGLEHLAFAWLIPGLALTLATLVLLTWFTAWVSTGVVGATWAAGVVLVTGHHTAYALTHPTVQAVCAGVALALAVVLVLRTSSTRLSGGY